MGLKDLNDENMVAMRSAVREAVKSEKVSGLPPAAVPPRNEAMARFGQAMLVVGTFTAVLGLYPSTTSAFYRSIFLVFGVVQIVVGAWFVDRANRKLR